MNDQQYKKQVALLLRILPLVYKITDFAVHGGTKTIVRLPTFWAHSYPE